MKVSRHCEGHELDGGASLEQVRGWSEGGQELVQPFQLEEDGKKKSWDIRKESNLVIEPMLSYCSVPIIGNLTT